MNRISNSLPTPRLRLRMDAILSAKTGLIA